MPQRRLARCRSRHCRMCNGRRWQSVLNSGVQPHVEYGHNSDTQNKSQRNVLLRPLNFFAHHVQIVPAVVSPQSRDQRSHEPAHATDGSRKTSPKITPRPGRRSQCDDGNPDDHHHLKHCERQLERASLADSDVVQPRNKHVRRNRHQMTVRDDEHAARGDMEREKGLWQEVKCRKRSPHPYQAGGHACDGCGLRNQEPSPAIKKRRQRTIRVPHIHVLTARVRPHRAQFGVSQCAKKREQPPNDPSQVNQPRRPHRLHHLRRNEKNAAANNRPGDNRGRMPRIQPPNQLRSPRFCQSCRRCSCLQRHVRCPSCYTHKRRRSPVLVKRRML